MVSSISKMLSNKYTLYAVLAISLFTVLGYLAKHDFNSLTLFIAVYVLSCYFTKKTVNRLLAALLVTIFLGKPANKHWPWSEIEGMEGENHNTKGKKDKTDDEKKNMMNALKVMNDNKKNVSKFNKQFDQSPGLNKKLSMLQSRGDGLEGLQQINPKELEQHMKNMEPLVQSAQKLLDTFEKSGVMNMLNKLTPMLGTVLPKQ